MQVFHSKRNPTTIFAGFAYINIMRRVLVLLLGGTSRTALEPKALSDAVHTSPRKHFQCPRIVLQSMKCFIQNILVSISMICK